MFSFYLFNSTSKVLIYLLRYVEQNKKKIRNFEKMH
jgi:hypothetical protein